MSAVIEKVLPEFWLKRTDETEYWDEDFLEELRIKHVYDVFLLDRNSHTHICSFQASYAMHRVDTYVVMDDDLEPGSEKWIELEQAAKDAIGETMSGDPENDFRYSNVGGIMLIDDGVNCKNMGGLDARNLKSFLSGELTYEEAFQQMFEHCRSNQCL